MNGGEVLAVLLLRLTARIVRRHQPCHEVSNHAAAIRRLQAERRRQRARQYASSVACPVRTLTLEELLPTSKMAVIGNATTMLREEPDPR